VTKPAWRSVRRGGREGDGWTEAAPRGGHGAGGRAAADQRQAETITELREARRRLAADRDAAEARYTSMLTAQSGEPTAESPLPLGWYYWPLVVAVIVTVLAVGLLVPR
jgi:hypothetical protein